MKVNLSGILLRSADILKGQKADYRRGLGFMLNELYNNLEECRENPEKIKEFFDLYVK